MKPKRQRGMSLLEVVVAMLIMGVAIVGSIAMIQASERFNASANNEKMALYAAQDIIGKIRANSAAANSYANVTRPSVLGASSCFGKSCSSQQWALSDLKGWFNDLGVTLPGVDFSQTRVLRLSNQGEYAVNIAWTESADQFNAQDKTAQTHVYHLTLPFAL